MPRSLADGKIKLALLTVQPADPYHPTVAELTAGLDISCRVLSSGFALGATDSETVDEKALCQEGNAKVYTTSNYEGNLVLFRYFDSTGKAEATLADDIGDAAFQALKVKGTEAYLYKRFTSKKSLDPWAEGDEVEGYKVITDNAKDGEVSGYIKKAVPISVMDAWLNGEVKTTAA